jgi:hypothetical protein
VPLFRGGHAAEPSNAALPTTDQDSPTELRRAIFAINRFINQSSGRLPGEGVVCARRLTDTLREIVDISDSRPLDVQAALSVRGILNDYLPTTLRAYLAVDTDLVNSMSSAGRSPAQSLVEQLAQMQTSALAVLAAARSQDADALTTQGNFLRTKFTRSDLDLS